MPEIVITTLYQQFFLVASPPSLFPDRPVLVLSDMTKQFKDMCVHSEVPIDLTTRDGNGAFCVPVCDL